MSKRQKENRTRVGYKKAKRQGLNYTPLKKADQTFRTSNPCPNCGKAMTKDRNGMRCDECGDPYGNGK